mmetsp:Transcript_902/g.2164  ORF Transcript_902/g.2164 Transcript_902/m.2164 type:complete len:369 (+) Transcript_902:180-1286(+)
MASFLEKFLFPTPTPSYSDSSFPRELLWVPVESDAVPVVLLLSPNARYLVLYFHSNGEDIGLCYSFARSLSTLLEVHVLLVEYPGYGICPGTASENSLLKAAHAAFRFVSEQLRWPAEDVIIMGRSLGAAVASQLAARVTCNGLILVAPFASLVEAAHHHVGVLARVLSNDVFNNRDHICKVSAPTLIVHGKNDTVVPCSQGRQLYDLSSARKLFVNPEGMHHNSDLLTVADILIKPVLRFFCLPDYTFQSLEVPPEFFGWRHRQQDKAMVVDMEGTRRTPAPTVPGATATMASRMVLRACSSACPLHLAILMVWRGLRCIRSEPRAGWPDRIRSPALWAASVASWMRRAPMRTVGARSTAWTSRWTP